MKKTKGRIRFTKEVLHGLIGLPQDVRIDNVHYDPTIESLDVTISSDEPIKGLTNHIDEAQVIIEADYDVVKQLLIERNIRIYENVRNQLTDVEEGEGIL